MKFILREGFKKLKNYKKLTFATFLTSTISYFVFGLFLLLTVSLISNFNSFQKNEIKIIAFLNPKSTQEQIEEVKDKISIFEGVTNVKYIDNTQALKDLGNDFDDSILTNDLKEDNPLPHTFIIGFKNTKSADVAFSRLKTVKNIENINYEKQYLNDINKTLHNIKIGLIFIVIGLLLSSIFFISIVISLSIHQQRQNIKTMLLTGAPIKYISMPFIIQGLLISISSAIISSLMTIYMYKEYISVIQKILPFLATTNLEYAYKLIPVVILILGIILGGLGSFIASKSEIRRISK